MLEQIKSDFSRNTFRSSYGKVNAIDLVSYNATDFFTEESFCTLISSSVSGNLAPDHRWLRRYKEIGVFKSQQRYSHPSAEKHSL